MPADYLHLIPLAKRYGWRRRNYHECANYYTTCNCPNRSDCSCPTFDPHDSEQPIFTADTGWDVIIPSELRVRAFLRKYRKQP